MFKNKQVKHISDSNVISAKLHR